MADLITPLVYVGGSRATPIEALLADAQEAVAHDLIERLLACPEYERPIIATNSPRFVQAVADLPVLVVPDEAEFHFGRSLARIVDQCAIRTAFYVGGGAAPLLSTTELTTIAELLRTNDEALVANNFFSSDFVGFSPARAIQRIAPPRIDNDLAFRLQREGGLRNIPLARTPGTQMDVDTPTDLLILSLHPGIGPHLRQFFANQSLDPRSVREVGKFLTDPNACVAVCGRVGSHLWAHLDSDLACRTRVFSEERGMRANGREVRGEVRSLLGYHLEAVGADRFFENLATLADAAFIDSRVLMAHLRLEPSASDRFYSDLLAFDSIENPALREFTRAAATAPLPVVLGGHSLVSGGLWALIDAAWLQRDRERGETWTA
ncbi:MAG TPA: hypothetical protein VMW65_06295 [Chloroflexota bacterium]|nr:hypothetical protein [Chloroflexota bacterium]